MRPITFAALVAALVAAAAASPRSLNEPEPAKLAILEQYGRECLADGTSYDGAEVFDRITVEDAVFDGPHVLHIFRRPEGDEVWLVDPVPRLDPLPSAVPSVYIADQIVRRRQHQKAAYDNRELRGYWITGATAVPLYPSNLEHLARVFEPDMNATLKELGTYPLFFDREPHCATLSQRL